MSRELLQQALDSAESTNAYYGLIKPLKAELAKPEPEPVAWRIPAENGTWEYETELPDAASIAWSAQYGRSWEPLYASEPPTKEDAARYQLAKRAYHAQSPQMDGTFHFSYSVGDVRLPRARTIDAAFDAAIAQEEKPE